MSRNIYDIGAEIDQIADAFDQLEAGEATPDAIKDAVFAYFGVLLEERERKLDGYAYRIQQLTDTGKARKADADRLAALARTDLNQAAAMKTRLCEFLRYSGIKRTDSLHYKFTVCGNGGLRPLEITGKAEDYVEEPKYRHFIVKTYTAVRRWVANPFPSTFAGGHVWKSTDEKVTHSWDEAEIRRYLERVEAEAQLAAAEAVTSWQLLASQPDYAGEPDPSDAGHVHALAYEKHLLDYGLPFARLAPRGYHVRVQ